MTMTEGKQHEAGTADGWHGQVKAGSIHPPEANRYHLYIGLFCPFAHRANLIRHLKGLQDAIDISVVRPYPKGDDKGWPGWRFASAGDEYPGATEDRLFGSRYLHEVYFRADPEYQGRYSVPLLWDTKTDTIVSNESAEMLRWLPSAFSALNTGPHAELDLYPPRLQSEIDAVAEWMQRDLNTGVYKSGFAPDQATYETNVVRVFAALNKLEKLVAENGGPYVLGEALTELDVRLYPTLIRFDTVYVQHFKCNLGTMRHEYPVLHTWLKNLYWNVPAFRDTTELKHIKENYTKSHPDENPRGITPLGPVPDVEEGGTTDFTRIRPGGESGCRLCLSMKPRCEGVTRICA